VNSRRQGIGLDTGLAVQRHNRAVRQSAVLAEQDPLLVYDPYLVFCHNDSPKEIAQDCLMQHNKKKKCDNPAKLPHPAKQIHDRSLLAVATKDTPGTNRGL